jgi:predicted ATP-grasp superfamily ATP-dependent carboligase
VCGVGGGSYRLSAPALIGPNGLAILALKATFGSVSFIRSTMDNSQLFIAGATARSAAVSARRAGWHVTAADLFCDRDLQAVGDTFCVQRYPDDVLRIASRLSPRQWIYTGGLENAPEVVDDVSRRHELLGNSGNVLRRVRDPWQVQRVLRQAGCLSPELSRYRPEQPHAGWLRKPKASCGGLRIARWRCDNAERTDRQSDNGGKYFYQREISGLSCGALYVGSQSDVRFIGVVRQLRGRVWGAPGHFQYVGSIGPIRLSSGAAAQFRRMGDCLAGVFGLSGLFGIDAIVERGRVWCLEVNPRYTASVEVHERARQWCALQTHQRACSVGCLDDLPTVNGSRCWGKAIVYARQPVTIGQAFCDWVDHQNRGLRWPALVDLPKAGTYISTGRPILTVLTEYGGLAETARRLRLLVRQVRAQAVDLQG